jgi:hypothetical protein
MKSISPQECDEKLAIHPAAQEFQTQDDPLHTLKFLKSRHEGNLADCGSFYFASENELLRKKMQNTLDTDYIKKIIAAGTLPTLVYEQSLLQIG